MKQKNTIQQGDVLLKRIVQLPEGCESVARGRIVVAHGESGHTHLIDAPPDSVEMFSLGERMFLKTVSPVMLKHEEHGAVELDGLYEIGRVREFDWFSQMERKVID